MREKGQLMMRKGVENKEGCKDSKRELHNVEAARLKVSQSSEVMILQHSTVDVHNADTCITRNLLYFLSLFSLRQFSSMSIINTCTFLGLTLDLLSQNLKVGSRNLHFGKMQR